MSRYFLKSILNQPKLPTTEISKYALAKAIGKLSEDNELKFLSQFKKHSIKKRFAIFGRNSGKLDFNLNLKNKLFFIKV